MQDVHHAPGPDEYPELFDFLHQPAADLGELREMIESALQQLGAVNEEWMKRHRPHELPRLDSSGGILSISGQPPHLAAFVFRRRAARQYRDQLRAQARHLWKPGMTPPPTQDDPAGKESDLSALWNWVATVSA